MEKRDCKHDGADEGRGGNSYACTGFLFFSFSYCLFLNLFNGDYVKLNLSLHTFFLFQFQVETKEIMLKGVNTFATHYISKNENNI